MLVDEGPSKWAALLQQHVALHCGWLHRCPPHHHFTGLGVDLPLPGGRGGVDGLVGPHPADGAGEAPLVFSFQGEAEQPPWVWRDRSRALAHRQQDFRGTGALAADAHHEAAKAPDIQDLPHNRHLDGFP